MSADDLLRWLTQALFVAIFAHVLSVAIRRPRRAAIDVALFFGVLAVIVVIGWVREALNAEPNRWVSVVTGALLMALPYLLLRLVADFGQVPAWLLRLAEVGLVLAVVGLVVIPSLPAGLVVLYVAYFVALQVYAAVKFVRRARHSGGVTRRRMQAAAAGSLFLGLVLLVVLFQLAFPGMADLWLVLSRAFGLLSGVSYYIGFAPPDSLRRAWQEPELRRFLGRAASLPRLPETAAIVQELERGAGDSLGAPGAALGLWDSESQQLVFRLGEQLFLIQPGKTIGGQAFGERRARYSDNAVRDDPEHAEVYQAAGACAVLAAPIIAGTRPLGVLTVYAPFPPIFADEDLALVQLLADQAAVILESRALIDEAARVRAREEATRLKDDFLSAAAHDLKTPLTTLIAQAQLLERRAQREPSAPTDIAGLRMIVSESRRLNELVLELLDASRLEQGGLNGSLSPVDLVQVARQVCTRYEDAHHPCSVTGDELVVGEYNERRMQQLIQNLVENAVKYSPTGGEVEVRLWQEGETNRISVSDQGIGIPSADLPHLFERFHRGSNVDDRRFAGMGLGLYICYGIVREHGGRIWATSTPGQGSTFHVALPVKPGETNHDGGTDPRRG